MWVARVLERARDPWSDAPTIQDVLDRASDAIDADGQAPAGPVVVKGGPWGFYGPPR